MKFCLYFWLIYLLYVDKISSDTKIDKLDRYSEGEVTNTIPIDIFYTSGLFLLNVYIGSPVQGLQLILDTQRSFITVLTNKCEASKEIITFNDSKSQSLNIINSNYTVDMYKETLEGRFAKDRIILSEQIKIDKFNLFLVDKVYYKEKFNWQGYFGIGFSQNKEDNFVYKLYQNGKINKPMYSILMRGGSGYTNLQLGGYDTKLINSTNYEKIKWSNVTYTKNDNFTNWFIQSDKVYLNGINIDKNHKIILNSASNIIRIPKTFFFDNLNKIFNKQSECQIWKDDVFHCKCNNDWDTIFPTFKFEFQNFNLTIPPLDYLMLDNSGIQTSDSSSYCLLRLSPNYENDYWILGINFMNDFYTIFDLENDRLGFYNVNDLDLGSIEDIILLSLIILMSSIMFFSILYCVYKKIMNGRQNEPLLN